MAHGRATPPVLAMAWALLALSCQQSAPAGTGWLTLARAAVEAQAPGAAAAVEALSHSPTPERRLALARALFPEHAADVAPADLPGRQQGGLQVRLGERAAPAMTLKTRGLTFRVLGGDGGAPLRTQDGAAAFDGERHLWAPAGRWRPLADEPGWQAERAEEYWVLERALSRHRAEYAVELPPEVREVRDTGDWLELLDATGTPVLRFHPSAARDATGRSRSGSVQLRGVEPVRAGVFRARSGTLWVATAVELGGLTFPVVVDPGWSATGSMANARLDHAATTLANGKVLVTGGYNSTYLGSAELYDPATGTWSSAGNLATARRLHRAALLPSGRVLVVGGQGAGGALATTELYDPATNAWSAGPSLAAGRYNFVAVPLQNGKVLAVSGSGASGYISSVELYDPATNAWSPAGNLATARGEFAGARLLDGRVLIAGGLGSPGYLATAERYDPSTNTWSPAGTFTTGRYAASLTTLDTGKALLAGGDNNFVDLATAQLYDPATNTWSAAGSMAGARRGHTDTLLTNGKVLVTGGFASGGQLQTTELYDPGTNTWSSAGNLLLSKREQHAAARLANGLVLVVGGRGGFIEASSELYDPGLPGQLAFTTPVRTFTAGTCGGAANAITVQLRDGSGNPINAAAGGQPFTASSSSTGTVTWFTDAACATAAPGGAFTLPAGQTSVSLYYRDTRAGTPSLSLSNGAGLTNPAPQVHSVLPGPAAALALSGVSSPLLAGAAASPALEARDGFGNLVPGYRGTVHFTSTDAAAVLPGDYTFSAGDGGRRLFTGQLRLNTPGLQSLTATDVSVPALTATLGGLSVVQPSGAPCGSGAACATGFCADGVCCDSACTGNPCRACNNAGSAGTCGPRPNGASCADGSYCNGEETCSAGSCTAGAAVACVDPLGRDVLTCSEAQRACAPVLNLPPVITRNARLTAGVGIPYLYNAQRAISATGDRPMTFSTCGGPAGWKVDPTFGTVMWTPSAAGQQTLCLAAQNAVGSDSYTFTVQVAAATGGPPVAAFVVSPPQGPAPLAAQFDASSSSADPSTSLAGYGWQFAPGAGLGSGVTAAFTYPVPGGYRPELTVWDAFGREAFASMPVSVLAPGGRRPPAARILASPAQGAAPLVSQLGCDCQPGDAPLAAHRWDFGDGSSAAGPSVSRTFPAGRYHLRLTVTDEAGLSATDSVELVATEGGRAPPTCRLEAAPLMAAAPFGVLVQGFAAQPAGSIASSELVLWDGSVTAEPSARREVTAPGRYPVRFRVVDDATLPCSDSLELVALGPAAGVPPRIVSAPAGAGLCGEQASYSELGRPVATGDLPLSWSVEPAPGLALPEGLTVDAATGALAWRPSGAQAGLQSFVLRASNAAGTDSQRVEISVECVPVKLALGCGCSGGGDLCAAAFALLALGTIARRRR